MAGFRAMYGPPKKYAFFLIGSLLVAPYISAMMLPGYSPYEIYKSMFHGGIAGFFLAFGYGLIAAMGLNLLYLVIQKFPEPTYRVSM